MQAKTLHGAVPALLEPCGPGGLKGNPALFVVALCHVEVEGADGAMGGLGQAHHSGEPRQGPLHDAGMSEGEDGDVPGLGVLHDAIRPVLLVPVQQCGAAAGFVGQGRPRLMEAPLDEGHAPGLAVQAHPLAVLGPVAARRRCSARQPLPPPVSRASWTFWDWVPK